jgi:hypothetical protein
MVCCRIRCDRTSKATGGHNLVDPNSSLNRVPPSL